MKRIYMDYTATTPVDGRVTEAMLPYFGGLFGNASSIHSFGREAKAALEESRETLAHLMNVRSGDLYFTSGGTESDNAALVGLSRAASSASGRHIVISAIEHHAVLHSARALESDGFTVTVADVDSHGFLTPEQLRRAIRNDTFLVSVIHANNEIGTIQEIETLAAVAHENNALFHTDAVQSFGKIGLDVTASGIDLASFTAHKIYGPKGIGALYIRRGINFEPVLHGGSQERNRRPGTESIPLVVGFAKAAQLAVGEIESEQQRLAALNKSMRRRIEREVPGALFNSPEEKGLPQILNVSLDSNEIEIDGEALIVNMDLEGIAVTSGSACSSGSLQPSHVIRALGRDDKTTMATVRFSIGRFTTEEEADTAVTTFSKVVGKIGKRKSVISPVS